MAKYANHDSDFSHKKCSLPYALSPLRDCAQLHNILVFKLTQVLIANTDLYDNEAISY